MDFFASDNWIEPERGDLLVSEPYLPDPNFERTVILLCEHDDNGTFGFVLNKKTNIILPDVIKETNNFDADLYLGGPVQQNSLHFIHRKQDVLPSAKEVKRNLYWGGDYDVLMSLIDTYQVNKEDFRFFSGYSGWSPGQLNEELNVKSWIIFKNVDDKLIFETKPEDLWKEVLNRMGGKYKLIANYPVDPRLN